MSSHNLVNKDILDEVCPQLKQLRLDHQLSIEELQAVVHIKSGDLRRIEYNKYLTFSHLRRLLDFYGNALLKKSVVFPCGITY